MNDKKYEYCCFSQCCPSVPPPMNITNAKAPSPGQRHLYGCTQNLCVLSACKCINQELFLHLCVCMAQRLSGSPVAGPGIQCSVNALICSFGIRRNLKPGNKTIKTICNFDMFIHCRLSAFKGYGRDSYGGREANTVGLH